MPGSLDLLMLAISVHFAVCFSITFQFFRYVDMLILKFHMLQNFYHSMKSANCYIVIMPFTQFSKLIAA